MMRSWTTKTVHGVALTISMLLAGKGMITPVRTKKHNRPSFFRFFLLPPLCQSAQRRRVPLVCHSCSYETWTGRTKQTKKGSSVRGEPLLYYCRPENGSCCCGGSLVPGGSSFFSYETIIIIIVPSARFRNTCWRQTTTTAKAKPSVCIPSFEPVPPAELVVRAEQRERVVGGRENTHTPASGGGCCCLIRWPPLLVAMTSPPTTPRAVTIEEVPGPEQLSSSNDRPLYGWW
jgi:hypothetical protein